MAKTFETLSPGDYAYMLVEPGVGVGREPYELHAVMVGVSREPGVVMFPALSDAVVQDGKRWRFRTSGHPVTLLRGVKQEKLSVVKLREDAAHDVKTLAKELSGVSRDIELLQAKKRRIQGEVYRRRNDEEGHMLRLADPL